MAKRKQNLEMVTAGGVCAPGHLSADSAAWFAVVVRDWPLDDHHVRLLTLAAEAWDRAAEARLVIAEHGITYTDRFGAPRMHPAVVVERDARLGFARLLRELDLDAPLDMPAMAVRRRRR
jgi:phage terminase small subunit